MFALEVSQVPGLLHLALTLLKLLLEELRLGNSLDEDLVLEYLLVEDHVSELVVVD